MTDVAHLGLSLRFFGVVRCAVVVRSNHTWEPGMRLKSASLCHGELSKLAVAWRRFTLKRIKGRSSTVIGARDSKEAAVYSCMLYAFQVILL